MADRLAVHGDRVTVSFSIADDVKALVDVAMGVDAELMQEKMASGTITIDMSKAQDEALGKIAQRLREIADEIEGLS
ncbi:MAG: hypothetical protein ACFE0Q_20785 [Anaerolineae bacterium]